MSSAHSGEMSATILYVQACKFMLVPDEHTPSMWEELFSLLPKLRQSLSCRVCRGLLVDPFGSLCCEHYVCRGCLKKKRSLNPGCRWCQNLDKLVEEKQIRIVLACYKKFCEYISESSAVRNMQVQNGEYNKTLAILQEAIASPIDLKNTNKGHLRVPEAVMTPAGSNSDGNNKMAVMSRDQPPALLSSGLTKPLSKRKVIQLLSEPKEGNEQPKKKKKKFFKGSCYTYKKKRTAAKIPKQQVEKESDNLEMKSQPIVIEDSQTDSPADKSGTEKVAKHSRDIEVIEIIDNNCPTDEVQELTPDSERKRSTKTTRSHKHKKLDKKVKKQIRCRCGNSCKPGIQKCIGPRCPCIRSKLSCLDCSCKDCANPLNDNNNNGKGIKIS